MNGKSEDLFSNEMSRSSVAKAAAGGETSMPRFMRTMLRRGRRFVLASRPMKAGGGSMMALAFITCGLLFGAFTGGHGPVVMSGAANAVGLTATNIVITGQLETSESAVLNALALSQTRSLVGFDASDARTRMLALPWVREATLRKLYPGKLFVSLKEKTPFAVWQRGEHLSVVEQDGKLISRFGIADIINDRFAHLPHLVGEGAAENASQILPLFAKYPLLASKAQAYIRVADRRWDVHLAGDVKLKLPEKGMAQAFTRFVALEEESWLLDRQISEIDMRLEGRVVVRLLSEAAAARTKIVTSRLKAMKKAERRL